MFIFRFITAMPAMDTVFFSMNHPKQKSIVREATVIDAQYLNQMRMRADPIECRMN